MKTVRRGPQSAFARLFPQRYLREILSNDYRPMMFDDDEHVYSPRAQFESRCRLEERREKFPSTRLIADFPSRTTKLEQIRSSSPKSRTTIIFCHCSCPHAADFIRRSIRSPSINHYDVPRVFYDDQDGQWKVDEPTVS